jgi:hypothetical protein
MGVYRQRLALSSGPFAMIDDGLGFQLVPWSPSLEKKLDEHVSGATTRHDGGFEWTIGRKRGLDSNARCENPMRIGSGPSYFFFQLKYVAWLIPALRQMSTTGIPSAPYFNNERLLCVRKLRSLHRSPLLCGGIIVERGKGSAHVDPLW